MASNAGTVGDVDGDNVSLAVSIGTIVNNGDGTWSWSYQTDGTTADQTVIVTASDGNGGSDSATFELVVTNLPPTGEADVASQSVQCGDVIAPVTITGTDVAGDSPLVAAVAWSSDGTNFVNGLPTGLTLAADGCATDGQVECGWTVAGIAGVAAGDYVIRMSITDPQGSSVDVDIALSVLLEDTRVAFDSANPVSVEVTEDGGDGEVFSLSTAEPPEADPGSVTSPATAAAS